MNRAPLSLIMELLEELAPSALAEEWDNVGLMVGSPADPVSGITISLDATVAALEAARKADSDLLLTHHPLLFKPLSTVDPSHMTGAVVYQAVREGIAVLAAHTNLDSGAGGVNDVLAGLLGLTGTSPLIPSPKVEGAGMGRLGELERPLNLGEAVKAVKEALGLKAVMVVGGEDRPVRRVAVCGGSGGDLIGPAKEAGADLLITGEVGHHRAREAEFLDLAVIEAGHFATEIPIVLALAGRLKEALKAAGIPLAVNIFEEEMAPFRLF